MELQPWQHDIMLTIPIGDFCIWIEETKLHEYTVWGAATTFETPKSIWVNLMTGYVLYVLWKSYYRHYRVLLSNLQRIGIAPEYVRYQIVVGDPTYAILCDPIVAFDMALDTWLGVAYCALAIIGVTQFQEVAGAVFHST
ncbi:hypothetical protein AC1031_009644 [Aphanomyces cochlioides]|nr:hypothetical protein AC1031_009644 [Aphanomyces cochlioides]